MRKQSTFGWLATLALLLSLSMAACIQPVTASGGKTGEMAVAQGSADEATEINKEAMRQWTAAFNAHDLSELDRAVDKYYATDYVLHDPTVPNFSGGGATNKQLVRETLKALPDIHITIEEMIAEGDSLAIRSTVTGTQPDGKALSFTAMSMIRFVDGQLAEEWQLVGAAGEEVTGSDVGQK